MEQLVEVEPFYWREVELFSYLIHPVYLWRD